MFARASLSSVQQHLVICDSNINTVVKCGGVFILSGLCVFFKIECFAAAAAAATLHRAYLDASSTMREGCWVSEPHRSVEKAPPVCLSTSVALSDQCFHRRRLTQRALLLAGLGGMRGQGSSEARGRKKGKNGIHGRMVEVEGG